MKTMSLFEVTKERLREYGQHILSNRAIPDARDGLSPVQRAILVGAKDIGLSSKSGYLKSARLTGHVMGKLHPHGSSYGVVVNMSQANAPSPLIEGKGNWGSAGGQDGAAAERYTECRLTALADSMLDPLGMSIVDCIPNYDDTMTLPIVLPAREPILLYNGAIGIAYGTTTGIPPFKRKGVLELAASTIESGTAPDIKMLRQNLHLNYRWGGENVTERAAWKEVLRTGRGSIKIAPEYRLEKDQIIITSIPPHFNWEKIAGRLQELPEVRVCQAQSDEQVRFVIGVKKGVDVEAFAENIISKMASRVNTVLNVVVRKKVAGNKLACEFNSLDFSGFFERWCKYRVDLEKRLLAAEEARLLRDISRTDLFLSAINNLDRLVKLIRKKGQTRPQLISAIGSLLKVNEEEAQVVLSITLGRLSSLEEGDVLDSQKKLKNALKDVRQSQKDVAGSAASALRAAL